MSFSFGRAGAGASRGLRLCKCARSRVDGAHAMPSRDFDDRQNATAEMDATMKKMMIETAQARP